MTCSPRNGEYTQRSELHASRRSVNESKRQPEKYCRPHERTYMRPTQSNQITPPRDERQHLPRQLPAKQTPGAQSHPSTVEQGCENGIAPAAAQRRRSKGVDSMSTLQVHLAAIWSDFPRVAWLGSTTRGVCSGKHPAISG